VIGAMLFIGRRRSSYQVISGLGAANYAIGFLAGNPIGQLSIIYMCRPFPLSDSK